MRNKRVFVLCVLSVVMLYASVCSVLAKAPDTPKIVFASFRDGNVDIYLMNPDGTQQVKITNHRAIDNLTCLVPDRRTDSFFIRPEQGTVTLGYLSNGCQWYQCAGSICKVGR